MRTIKSARKGIQTARKGIQNFLIRLWRDESDQGATEYILIMVVIGALIVAFKKPLLTMIKTRTNDVSTKLGGFIQQINP